YVRTSTCTYQVDEDTLADRQTWLAAHDEAHPVTVAIDDGRLVGWGALSWFRQRFGYRFTVEDTVYVRPDMHRRGIGRALVVAPAARARALGHKTVIAGISAEQEGSIRLHERLGFRPAGVLQAAGFKFETWLDLAFLQLVL